MKIFTKAIQAFLLALAVFCMQSVKGQSILNPADSVITYNASAAKGSLNNPNGPAPGTIGKWIRTVRVSFNTNLWKCYIYNGIPFRLIFPKSYNPTANDGKKYPMLIFFHGAGELGPATDNELSLANGGQFFTNSITNGLFDGYILVQQAPQNGWDNSYFDDAVGIINYMIPNNKLDPFRIATNGLSAGGEGSWAMTMRYPSWICANLPMSGINLGEGNITNINLFKFTRVWDFQGGLDTSPDPNTAGVVTGDILAAGGNYKYTLYPTLGHGTWNTVWAEPNFWPFIDSSYSSNPWTLFGQTAFCPGASINVTIGVAPNFTAYQWRQNGIVLATTTNSINATSTGTYDCRVEQGSVWSDWSHIPVVISTKLPTVTPPISISGLMSDVIPALDNKGVTLQVPQGYASYTWQKTGDTTTRSTKNTINVTTPGQYIVEVTEQFGCSSSFSPPFTVIDANGPNKPDPASGLSVSALSQTSILLNWSQNPAPQNNETGFEIYQGTQSGGPYKLVFITAPDISKDTITGLNAGVKYYYVIRAVDGTGAAATSNEAGVSTIADVQPPTAPGALTITGTSINSVGLSWTASTDNVGVVGYDIYVNGAKAYTVPPTQTSFTVYSLVNGQSYAFIVKARDLAGNASPASNQVSGESLVNGIPYNYYNNLLPSLTALPNFSQLQPVSSGFMPNFSLSPGNTDLVNFGILFQGYIVIPTTGKYTFETNSDDGSRMYLGALGGIASPYTFTGTPLVNNDGLHGGQNATSSSIQLTAGVYPFAVAYFQQGGGTGLTVSWKVPGSSSFVAIPNSAFIQASINNGSAPAAPSNLVATAQSFKAIGLTWKDNSSNEGGFEVWRSTSPANTGAIIIGTTGAGATTYIDSTASASTKYFYEVRAVNTFGASNFTSNYTEAEFKFNNNYNDSTGNGHSLTAIGSPTFDATNKQEGTFSVKLNGTNQAITINNTPGSFLQESYFQRTIACWIKSSGTTGANRVIWDIGGSTNGLSLVLNNTTLTAAIASASSRKSITTTLNNTNWNHVAVVYYGDSLMLYVNGVLASSNLALGFHSIATTTDGARIGQTNGTNALNTNGGFFGGNIDDFSVFNTALTADVVQSLMNFTYQQSNAITQALPAIPGAPTGLSATATSPAGIKITWLDNANNETNLQLYRSNGNDQSFFLLAVLPANTISYKDSGLFANAAYYYKVNAVNAGGTSAWSNEGSATTLDVPPVIVQIASQQARYGTTTIIPVSATLPGSGTITLQSSNLPPAFAQFTDNGNGTGKITLNPAPGDAGVYNNLTVTALDAFGGSASTQFTLTVNNNFPPTLDSIANYTMNAGDSVSIALNGHNVNTNDTLTLSVTNLPNTFSITQGTSGAATLLLHPGYAASGTYYPVVTVKDNNGISVTRSFVLVVNKVDPTTRIYTRFTAGDAVGSPWNSITGPVSANFLDNRGNTTTVGLTVTPTWWYATSTAGPTTGNNSGVYPDAVLQDYYYFGDPRTSDIINAYLTGLDTSKRYSLTFLSSSIWNGATDNGKTSFTAGSQTATLEVQNNTQNTVTLSNLAPDPTGTLMFAMGRVAGAPAGLVNAIVISLPFDDGTAPAAATSLQAQLAASTGNGVNLTWNDPSYNEDSYLVYRSTHDSLSFTLIATLPANSTAYADITAPGNTLSYYRVVASNVHGVSPYSNIASIATPDRIPLVTAIANVVVSNNQTLQVNVTAVDDSTDHLTLTASGLPSFATFTDNGNGTGVVNIQPTAGLQGTFSGVTITATDMSDSSSSASFTINVVDPSLTYTYVNITNPSFLAPAPWNNFQIPYLPFATMNITNLTDLTGANTGITMTLTDAWDGFGYSGMKRRNGSDLYPETVSYNSILTTTNTSRRITLTGMDVAKAYNIQFFSSHNTSQSTLTHFTINGQSVVLDGSENSNKTAQINGVTPDANGTLVINCAKDTGAAFGMLSALVIESYTPGSAVPFAPADLRVLDYAKSNTISLQWQDRASGETGYEVWRAPDGGTYALLKSLPAGSTSYVDAGLPSNTAYDYIVRAVSGSNHSPFSNPVKGYTYTGAVFINLNNSQSPNPGAPFNSLNWVYRSLGTIWNNFTDETGAKTNIGMVQPVEWDEVETNGDVTHNNSGIFPDLALVQSFLNFVGDTSYITVTGLDASKTYDFTLMGSCTDDGTQNSTSEYTINGKTSMLNAHYNHTGTVTMFGITPDANGNVNITVDAYDSSNSAFSMIGVIVIKGYTPSNASITPAPIGTEASGNVQTATASVFNQSAQGSSLDSKPLVAYPNPFDQFFNLSVPAADLDNVLVSIMDVSGRTLFEQRFDGLFQGDNVLRIQPNTPLAPGVYFVNVLYINSGQRKLLKVVKR